MRQTSILDVFKGVLPMKYCITSVLFYCCISCVYSSIVAYLVCITYNVAYLVCITYIVTYLVCTLILFHIFCITYNILVVRAYNVAAFFQKFHVLDYLRSHEFPI